MSEERLEGLRAAVELSPDNHALRLVLAEALAARGTRGGARALRLLLDAGALPNDELVGVGDARRRARPAAARRPLPRGGAPPRRHVEGVAPLQRSSEER